MLLTLQITKLWKQSCYRNCIYLLLCIWRSLTLYHMIRMIPTVNRVARRPVFAGMSRFFDGRLWFTWNNQLEQSKNHKCHCDVVLNVLTKVYIQWVRAESGNLTHIRPNDFCCTGWGSLRRSPDPLVGWGGNTLSPFTTPRHRGLRRLSLCIQCLKCTKFRQLILRKIIKIVARF